MGNNDTRYLALLRGINVGGKNLISKEELKQCFESLGLQNVRTYIQSGNILFRSTDANIKELTSRITKGLSKQFLYDAQAVVFSFRQYKNALQMAPENWGNDEQQKHNALFLLGNLKATDVMAQLPPPVDELESVGTAKGVIFWSASKQGLGKTTIMKLGGLPVYKQMTVRNHNTAKKLLELFDEL